MASGATGTRSGPARQAEDAVDSADFLLIHDGDQRHQEAPDPLFEASPGAGKLAFAGLGQVGEQEGIAGALRQKLGDSRL